MAESDDLIGIREFARRIGVSDTAVHKAIKLGRIKIAGRTEKSDRPLLSWSESEPAWWASSNPNKRTHIGPEGSSPRRASYADPKTPTATNKEPLSAGVKPDEPEAMALDDDGLPVLPKNPTIAQSREFKEAYGARIEKINHDKAAGLLVEVAKVKRDAFKLARSVRDAMLNIPDRCAAELAAQTDANRIHQRLTEEIRQALQDLTNEIM